MQICTFKLVITLGKSLFITCFHICIMRMIILIALPSRTVVRLNLNECMQIAYQIAQHRASRSAGGFGKSREQRGCWSQTASVGIWVQSFP